MPSRAAAAVLLKAAVDAKEAEVRQHLIGKAEGESAKGWRRGRKMPLRTPRS